MVVEKDKGWSGTPGTAMAGTPNTPNPTGLLKPPERGSLNPREEPELLAEATCRGCTPRRGKQPLSAQEPGVEGARGMKAFVLHITCKPSWRTDDKAIPGSTRKAARPGHRWCRMCRRSQEDVDGPVPSITSLCLFPVIHVFV